MNSIEVEAMVEDMGFERVVHARERFDERPKLFQVRFLFRVIVLPAVRVSRLQSRQVGVDKAAVVTQIGHQADEIVELRAEKSSVNRQ